MREWIDDHTGRTVRQITNEPEGAMLGYFRLPRRLPGNRMLADGGNGRQLLLDFNTGENRELSLPPHLQLGLEESTGTMWYRNHDDRKVWRTVLPAGEPELVGEIPAEWEASGLFISCNGETLIGYFAEADKSVPLPTTMELEPLWAFIRRWRKGSLRAYNFHTGQENAIIELEGVTPIHCDPSPTDPGLVRYAEDNYDAICQRIWTVRTDGGGHTKIRPQEHGELVTHEFWWPGGGLIAYKYQDRRKDDSLMTVPWAEYSPIPTQFALANLKGEEVYLSDPINHYHTHISVSPDTKLLCGEGTDGHSFVYVASFSQNSTKIDFVPQARVHTPYVPFRGQLVNATFTTDGQWLVYNDTVEGKLQVCAVKVEL